ncbi:DMT family transporter [Streptomyces uncialis]|uniref:DMT family transporter n=1 Tax=Streptomyces uncialis TaxID=1048205 RepID=UPI00386DA210|nr:DMT family transporter [Streptomyces uncialis]
MNTTHGGRAGAGTGAQFLVLAAVWGASFLFIKVSVAGLSPVQVVLGRLGLGALCLAAVMAATRRRWPRDLRTWRSLAVIAVFLCVLPFLLYAWAGERIPSGLSSIYNATTPLATLLVALAVLPDERLTRARTAGLLLAAAGVTLVASPWTTGGASLPGQLACLGAGLSYGIGFVLTRRLLRDTPHDTVTVAAVQVALATAITLLIAPFAGGFAPIRLTPSITASMLVLGIAGTGLAYILNNRIITAWGATAASTVTYLTPLVGVALGVTVLGETLHWYEPAGAALVVLGILISQGRFTTPRPRARGTRRTGPRTMPSTGHPAQRSEAPLAGGPPNPNPAERT